MKALLHEEPLILNGPIARQLLLLWVSKKPCEKCWEVSFQCFTIVDVDVNNNTYFFYQIWQQFDIDLAWLFLFLPLHSTVLFFTSYVYPIIEIRISNRPSPVFVLSLSRSDHPHSFWNGVYWRTLVKDLS